jgi:hypothetical protein
MDITLIKNDIQPLMPRKWTTARRQATFPRRGGSVLTPAGWWRGVEDGERAPVSTALHLFVASPVRLKMYQDRRKS